MKLRGGKMNRAIAAIIVLVSLSNAAQTPILKSKNKLIPKGVAFKILLVQTIPMSGGLGLRATMQAKNNSPHFIQTCTVQVNFYDGHDELVSSDGVVLHNVGPHQQRTLDDLATISPDAHIASFEIQPDSSYPACVTPQGMVKIPVYGLDSTPKWIRH